MFFTFQQNLTSKTLAFLFFNKPGVKSPNKDIVSRMITNCIFLNRLTSLQQFNVTINSEDISHQQTASVQQTCDERLISHRMSLNDPPIDRELPSGDDFHHITSLHQLNIHLLLTGTHMDD